MKNENGDCVTGLFWNKDRKEGLEYNYNKLGSSNERQLWKMIFVRM